MGIYNTKGITEGIEAIRYVEGGKTITLCPVYAVEDGVTILVFGGEKVLSYYGTAEGLSVGRSALAATTVGNHALFGGGYTGSCSAVVDAYDEELTRSIPTKIGIGRDALAATTVGNYALFGGGDYGSKSAAVVAYDEELTRSIPTALSVARYGLAATTLGKYAIFGGGDEDKYDYSAVVDAYDEELTRSIPVELSVARRYLAATTVGKYALFGGGQSEERVATVDVYQLS